MDKNGFPRIIETSLSSSMSKIMKYAGKMNLSTFTKTSFITPLPLAAAGEGTPHKTDTYKANFLSLVGPLRYSRTTKEVATNH